MVYIYNCMKIVITESQYINLVRKVISENKIPYPTDSNKIKVFQDWVDGITNGWILNPENGKFKRLDKGGGYGVMGPQTKKVWDILSTTYNYWNQRLTNRKDTSLIKKFQDSLTLGKNNLNKLLLQQRKEWEQKPKYDPTPNVPKTSDISKVPGFTDTDIANKDIADSKKRAEASYNSEKEILDRERQARLDYKLYSDEMESKGLVGLAIEDLKNLTTGKFDEIMEGLRKYLGGISGGIINTILELTGFGALAVTTQWAALALYDYSKENWIKLIFSMLGLITNGKLGQTLYKPLQAIWSIKVSSLEEGLLTVIKNPTINKIIGGFIDIIVKGLNFVSEGLQSAGKWLIDTFNITWAKAGIDWLVGKASHIIKMLTNQTDDIAVKKASEKVLQKGVINPANTYVADKANVGQEYNVTKAGAAVTTGGSKKADPAKAIGGVTKLAGM